jgi:uncharacterized YccA/Bax inhibitor family protein
MKATVVQQEGHIKSLSDVPGDVYKYLLGGCIGGFVVALIIIFCNKTAPLLSPVYAILEGVCLGAITAMFEYMYPTIGLQAVALTAGVFISLLGLYVFRIVKATENFKMGVIAATGGICLFYLVTIGLSFFGIKMPFIHETGMAGIGLSLFIVIVAALNLILDFDFIETGVRNKAPKYMEWYGAFGLLVTLVWLYLEILRLLAKLKKD